jgi:hypothetical protein
MSSYYYAMSSLPYLRLDGDQYPSREEFLETARDAADEDDFRVISSSNLDPADGPAPHPLVEEFHRWETGLRNELVRQRAAALERDGQAFVRRVDTGEDFTARSGLAEAVRAAVQAASPLKADESLDEMRWQYLEELEVGHFFTIEQMIVYYLKLQILLRRRSLTSEAGLEAFTGHYETVHSRMQQTQDIHGEQT